MVHREGGDGAPASDAATTVEEGRPAITDVDFIDERGPAGVLSDSVEAIGEAWGRMRTVIGPF
jgi:hypothetical protein